MEETTLLYHCRALCMDEADTLLDNAFVVVQGATIRSVGTERPAGSLPTRSTAAATSSCPASSTPTPTSP